MLPNKFILQFTILSTLLMVGCGSGSYTRSDADLAKISGGELKEVVPVAGKITVDGSPVAGVNVYFHSKVNEPPSTVARTDAAGKYCVSTYRPCDGIVPGEYLLTFKFMPKMTPNGRGEDLLKGRYADPQNTEFKLTAELRKPQKDVDFELNTK
jgi:hypothetical protein